MDGQQIGSYRIERTLGQGGFGIVYVAIDVRLGRRAAVKQLLPELSSNRDIVERFFNEAKAAASVNHPGIVEIYDVGWHTDGSAYFAMKLLDGDSLARRAKSTGPMPIGTACTIARQVAAALAAAHTRGIVHRDLKPDNIILVADDEIASGERATVLDFGIAKLFGDAPLSQKTRTGMMMGTPAYMSPEQCRGAGEVDRRTDVYALGCILFELLAGRPPFVSEGAGEILGMHQFVEPPPLRQVRPDVPPELESLVMRMLAKKAELRPSQMSEVQAALQPFVAVQSGNYPKPVAALMAPSSRTQAPSDPPLQQVPITDVKHRTTLPSGEVTIPAPPKRSKLPIVIAMIALVGIAVAGIVVATQGKDTDKLATMQEPNGSAPADATAVAIQTPADAPEVVAARPIDAPEVVDVSHGGNVGAAIGGESADPAPEDLKAEKLAELLYEQIEKSLDAGNFKLAEAGLAKMPKTTTYYPKAKALLDKAQAPMIEELARGLTDAKIDCALYAKLVAEAQKILSPTMIAKARAKAGLCKKTGGGDPLVQPDPGPTPPPSCANYDQLIADGVSALQYNQYARAIRELERAYACKPEGRTATMAGLAACMLKNKGLAKKWHGRGANKPQVEARCLGQGIDLNAKD